jgi:transposase-like protein
VGDQSGEAAADAHSEKVRREGRVLSTAVLRVIGISETGYREHLERRREALGA